MACHKSIIKWLAKRDANTSFFHASMRVKKKNKKIERMTLDDGSMLGSAKEVHEGTTIFF